MLIAIPRETAPGETRVALIPESVARLVKAGASVEFEAGAGLRAGFRDEAYIFAGAKIADAQTLLARADLVTKVQPPSAAEIAAYP